MSNVLLIGKDFPDSLDFCSSLCLQENKIFTNQNLEEKNINPPQNVFTTNWNKASAISAHSFIIKAETELQNINHVIFYFDSQNFTSKFSEDKTEEVAAANDCMINSFIFTANELIKRIDQQKEKITVTFLLKSYPSKAEVLSSAKNISIVPATNLVSSAEAAFEKFAENFAIYVNDRDYLSVILAKCPFSNEFYNDENAIANWVNESYKTISTQKNKQTVKQALNWVKVGDRISSGFKLFR